MSGVQIPSSANRGSNILWAFCFTKIFMEYWSERTIYAGEGFPVSFKIFKSSVKGNLKKRGLFLICSGFLQLVRAFILKKSAKNIVVWYSLKLRTSYWLRRVVGAPLRGTHIKQAEWLFLFFSPAERGGRPRIAGSCSSAKIRSPYKVGTTNGLW